jgi:hypothetical protein
MIILLTGSEGLPISCNTQSGSGVGKDEVAGILEEFGYVHLKFAESLRDLVYTKYNLDNSQRCNKEYELNHTVRNEDYIILYTNARGNTKSSSYLTGFKEHTVQELLILEGKEEVTKNPYVFIESVVGKIHRLWIENPDVNIVISDLRQWTEASVFKTIFKATIWDVQRKTPTRERQRLDGILVGAYDQVIYNNNTLDDLKLEVEERLRYVPCMYISQEMLDLFNSKPWNQSYSRSSHSGT